LIPPAGTLSSIAMKHSALSFLTFWLVILAYTSLLLGAQIKLEHADSSTATQIAGGMVYEFFGQVHFIRDSTDLFADYAARYEPGNLVRLCGGVRINEPWRILAADSLWYDQKSDMMSAWGRVSIEDRLRHVKATGGEAIYDGKTEGLVMSRHPKLIVDFDLPRALTMVTADTVKYHSRDDLVEATDSATISQGTLVAHSQQAVIYLDREEICMTGDVHSSQKQNELSGDEMTVFSENKMLERIEVVGKGEAIFRQRAATAADTIVFNQSRLTANRINFFFVNDVLDLIKAQGNSYTYYLPAKEDTAASGSNVASGDSTILKFGDAGLSEVFVVTSAEGNYWAPGKKDSLGNVGHVDTVTYSANRIHYKIAEKLIIMRETAKVTQATMMLDGDEIQYDLNTRNVYAVGHYDSTQAKYVPLVLKDKLEEMTGEQLVYNLDSKRGKIKESRTKLDQAYYSGGLLRKEVENEFLVRHGSYTTCDNPEPHFHFASKDMKLITEDKVFARPVVLYIESVPVFALPYFVFSTKKGRHSGFLPFQFGNFTRGQRFVRNLGYYWAISDYWDVKSSVDVLESSGLTFNVGASYAVRYVLSGNINGSFARETQFVGVKRTNHQRYQFNFSHSQTLDPTLSLSGSGQIVSDKSYYTDYSSNLDERLNRNMRSQINITKRFEGASLYAAVDQTKDLDRDGHTEKLPAVRFSLSQKPMFHQPKKSTDKRWYHDIYYTYNSSFLNYATKSMIDTVATRKKYAVLNQQFDLRAPVKFFNAITISPSVSAYDNWYYLPHSDQADSAQLQTDAVKGRQTWTSSVSLSTQLFGTVAPNVLSIVGLRHILSPSISFGYQPKIERNEEYSSFTGVGGSGYESKNASISVGNQLQMKYLRDGKEKKADLLKYNFSASYDFVRTLRRWSNLNSSLSSPNIKNLVLEMSFVHDLYASDGKLRWWNPTLKTISISSGYSGSFRIPVGLPGSSEEPVTPAIPTQTSPAGKGTNDSKIVRFGISQRYTETRGVTSSISHWISFNVALSISKNWSITYSQNYNIRGKETTDKSIEIRRDLHCWEGNFSWIPEGSREGFYFRLNVKLMPDVKLEKSESSIRDALFRMLPSE
jgi:lipopolysaccharide assembly outer membrane protein LptD (OstA)